MKKIILIFIIVSLIISHDSLKQKFLPFINEYIKSIQDNIEQIISK